MSRERDQLQDLRQRTLTNVDEIMAGYDQAEDELDQELYELHSFRRLTRWATLVILFVILSSLLMIGIVFFFQY